MIIKLSVRSKREEKSVKYFILVIISAILMGSTAFAQEKPVRYEKEYTYQASELDSKVTCRTIALEMVKRLLLEELGTYLIGMTEVKDMKLTRDKIVAYSAGIVGAEINEERFDGKTYWIRATLTADPQAVVKSINKITEDRIKSKDLENARKDIEALTRDMDELRKGYAKNKGNDVNGRDKRLENRYASTSRELMANEWCEKGKVASNDGDERKAIKYFGLAIMNKPDMAKAYNNRGVSYANLEDNQHAMKDFNMAIELDPKFAMAFTNRGVLYGKTDHYGQAIKDFNMALDLEPGYEYAYGGRALVYLTLGDYQQAIINIDKAIELRPGFAAAYGTRGHIYARLGNHAQAIKDYTKAIELKPNLREAYFDRGAINSYLGNASQAIKDYQVAARLGSEKARDVLRKEGVAW